MEKSSYTFVVQLPYKGPASYNVEIEEDHTVLKVFAMLVEETQGSDLEIPIELPTYDGRMAEVQWTFALLGEDGDHMLLAHDQSLAEQGVLTGAEIIVEDETNVGTSEYDRRFREDCIRLGAFCRANSEHFRVVHQTRRQIDIEITGVKAIASINPQGEPVYCEEHKLRILVPSNYPHEEPSLVPVSPIFHPNIAYGDGRAKVCYTEKYEADGEDTFTYMLTQWVRMVQYVPRSGKGWNLDGDHRMQNETASKWLEGLLTSKQHEELFPVKPLVRLNSKRTTIDLT